LSLPGGVFVNGLVFPSSADRSFNASVVGFNFIPPFAINVFPGGSSGVLVISTNATNFSAGNFSLISGGVATVAAFQPTSGATVPEPASLLLLSSGLVGLWFSRPRKS
jgi:hypothetical protein